MTEEEKEYLNGIVESIGSVDTLVKYTPLDLFYYVCRIPDMKASAKDGSGFDFFIELFEQKEYYEYCQVLLEAKKQFLDGSIEWNTESVEYYRKFLM